LKDLKEVQDGIASQSQGQKQYKDGIMQNQEEAQMSSQYRSADDVIVQFGFLSAFFAIVTLLLTLIFSLWHIMMFFVLWIVPISTFSTLIFGCIVLVKARKRFGMRRHVLFAILSLAIGLLCGIWFLSIFSSMTSST